MTDSVKAPSGYRGVYKCGKRWKAQLQSAGVQFYLGTFNTEEEAAKAYDRKARVEKGLSGTTNFDENGNRTVYDKDQTLSDALKSSIAAGTVSKNSKKRMRQLESQLSESITDEVVVSNGSIQGCSAEEYLTKEGSIGVCDNGNTNNDHQTSTIYTTNENQEVCHVVILKSLKSLY